MPAAADRIDFMPPAPPGALRSLLLALLAHALLATALTLGMNWKRQVEDTTIAAELWSRIPEEAAPAAVEPPPPPPVQEVAPPPPTPAVRSEVDIALEQEKKRLELAKLEQERLDKLQAEKRKQEELLRKQEQEKKLADEKKRLQEQQRREARQAEEEARVLEAQRQENLKRIAGMAGATGPAGSTGVAQQSAGPSPTYAAKLIARIKPNIAFTENVSGNPAAVVELRASPDGTIISRKLKSSSGVSSWDEAVLRAIDKTETIPKDTNGVAAAAVEISFRPKD